MTARMVLGWPIFSDVSVLYTPALSTGSWVSALPLTNLQDPRLSLVARSSDALAASTQFETDLGVARAVRVIALVKHNISTAGTWRVRGSSAAGTFSGGPLVYDSGTVNVWPTALTAEQVEGMNQIALVVPSAAQSARYWLIEITDTANSNGYVEIARLVIAGGWQPTINMSVGATLGLETDSTRVASDGGAMIHTRKPVRRTMHFTLADLPEAEQLGSGFDLQRIAGTSRQLFYVYDPDDTTLARHRSFLCTLQELSALDFPYLARASASYSLLEAL